MVSELITTIARAWKLFYYICERGMLAAHHTPVLHISGKVPIGGSPLIQVLTSLFTNHKRRADLFLVCKFFALLWKKTEVLFTNLLGIKKTYVLKTLTISLSSFLRKL